MTAARKQNRRQSFAEWLDELLPPTLQRAIASAVLMVVAAAMSKIGLDIQGSKHVTEQAATQVLQAAQQTSNMTVLVSEIVNAISNQQERAYAERRKTWTLSNDLNRIEGKIDAILEGTRK